MDPLGLGHRRGSVAHPMGLRENVEISQHPANACCNTPNKYLYLQSSSLYTKAVRVYRLLFCILLRPRYHLTETILYLWGLWGGTLRIALQVVPSDEELSRKAGGPELSPCISVGSIPNAAFHSPRNQVPIPRGPHAAHLRILGSKAIPGIGFGTRVLTWAIYGPFEM